MSETERDFQYMRQRAVVLEGALVQAYDLLRQSRPDDARAVLGLARRWCVTVLPPGYHEAMNELAGAIAGTAKP